MVLHLPQGAGLCWQVSAPYLYFHEEQAEARGEQFSEAARRAGCGQSLEAGGIHLSTALPGEV